MIEACTIFPGDNYYIPHLRDGESYEVGIYLRRLVVLLWLKEAKK